MRILVITQKVNIYDPMLGFFHRWLKEFAKHFNSITTICLEQGKYDLPSNVRVFSLGKETKKSRLSYIKNFYRIIYRERATYDAVFVHMNEEYVILGGLLWRLMGKKVTMWRNHHKGSFKTRIAGMLAHKVYCPSKFSYTASFPNREFMPVGIDTDFFIKKSEPSVSVLSIARITPVKKHHQLIEAFGRLAAQGIPFSASFYGEPLPRDEYYLQALKEQVRNEGIEKYVQFLPGVPSDMTPFVFSNHQISANLSSSGMYDKTILEAMACESLSLSCNKNLVGEVDESLLFVEDDIDDLTAHLKTLLTLSPEEKQKRAKAAREYVVKNHSLKLLGERLKTSLSQLC